MARLEDKIEKAIRPLTEMYSEIENDLLIKIAGHFSINEEFINSDYWRIKKLDEIGLFNQEIVEYIARYSNKTKEEVLKALKQIGIDTINLDNLNRLFEDEVLRVDPNILKDNYVINNMINLAYNELSNRFIQMSSKIEQSAREAYLNVVEKGYLETTMGTYSYQESIRSSIDQLGNTGLTTLDYVVNKTDGSTRIRHYDVTSTVRREILTASRQLSNKINMEVANQLDCEYLYLSEHIRCRPDHFDWQGTIIKKEDLVAVTDYGSITGLAGINCAHYFEPYFGDARGNDLKKISKKEATEQYNLSQKQRYLERGVRRWKRKTEMFKAIEDVEAYKKSYKKTREWQSRIREFTEVNDLRRDFTREYIVENKPLFKESIIERDYKNVSNKTETLMIYNINSGKRLHKVTNDSKNSVGDLKSYNIFLLSKKESLVAVHNHPANSSFSMTDIQTFNKFNSIGLIVVKTKDYLYYLEKKGIKKISNKMIANQYPKLYNKFVKIYGKNIETRHLVNKEFAKKIGWNYGRQKIDV